MTVDQHTIDQRLRDESWLLRTAEGLHESFQSGPDGGHRCKLCEAHVPPRDLTRHWWSHTRRLHAINRQADKRRRDAAAARLAEYRRGRRTAGDLERVRMPEETAELTPDRAAEHDDDDQADNDGRTVWHAPNPIPAEYRGAAPHRTTTHPVQMTIGG